MGNQCVRHHNISPDQQQMTIQQGPRQNPVSPKRYAGLALIMAPRIKNLWNAGKSLNPDKKANVSLALGLSAILLMLLSPATLVLEILPGFLAIQYGRDAIRNGTAKKRMAFSGQVLGIIVLTSLVLEIVVAVIILLIRIKFG